MPVAFEPGTARLELGCGVSPTPGYAHHDRIKHADHVDLAWDLRLRPWPFALRRDAGGFEEVVVDEALAAYARAQVDPPFRIVHATPAAEAAGHVRAALKALTRGDAGDALVAPYPVEYAPIGPPPLPAGILEEIVAFDVFEHVSAHIPDWLDECWRLLVPGGALEMRLPAWDNPLSWRDPTHLRVFHDEVFCYWDRRHPLHRDFGSIYFAESDRWWHVEEVFREHDDLRYRLVKDA